MTNDKFPYLIRHKNHNGEEGCDGVAFYLTKKLGFNDFITCEVVFHKDGTPTVTEEPMVCGTCEKRFCGGNIPLEWVEKNED